MEATVQRTSEGKYGIWIDDNWLKTHFEPESIETKRKDLLDRVAKEINTSIDEVILEDGGLDEPHIPLYFILSFLTKVKSGFDLVSDDHRWIISCDPVFHPVAGNEREDQIKYYEPVINWLELIDAKYIHLPQRYESREELEESGELERFLIDPHSADKVIEHWDKLNEQEQAAFYYIYLHAEHNFLAAFLVLKGVINSEEFGKLVTASLGVTPEFTGVTEATFNDGWQHYKIIAEKALTLLEDIRMN